jgi:hypothetical protein
LQHDLSAHDGLEYGQAPNNGLRQKGVDMKFREPKIPTIPPAAYTPRMNLAKLVDLLQDFSRIEVDMFQTGLDPDPVTGGRKDADTPKVASAALTRSWEDGEQEWAS